MNNGHIFRLLRCFTRCDHDLNRLNRLNIITVCVLECDVYRFHFADFAVHCFRNRLFHLRCTDHLHTHRHFFRECVIFCCHIDIQSIDRILECQRLMIFFFDCFFNSRFCCLFCNNRFICFFFCCRESIDRETVRNELYITSCQSCNCNRLNSNIICAEIHCVFCCRIGISDAVCQRQMPDGKVICIRQLGSIEFKGYCHSSIAD